MKVIILAAGRGSGLESLTEKYPKCMLKLGDEALIEREIRLLVECGIKYENIIVVGGYKIESIRLHKDITVIDNTLYEQTQNAYSLLLGLNGVDDDVLVMDGDLVFEKEVINVLINEKQNSLVVMDKDAGYGKTFVDANADGKVCAIGKHICACYTYASIMKICKNSVKILRPILEMEEYYKQWYTVPLTRILGHDEFKVVVSEKVIDKINSYKNYQEVQRKLNLIHDTILVTGASGFLGKKIYNVLKRDYNVKGLRGTSGNDETFEQIDLNDYDILEAYVTWIKPDIIIHVAGIADPDFCEKNKSLAYKTNVTATENVMNVCKKYGIKMIHISTDYVFDGDKDVPYLIHDKREPKNYYGETKKIAEDVVQQYNNSLIVRIPIIYGYNDENDKETFPIKVISALTNGEEIYVDNKQIRYPVLIDEVALVIKEQLYRNGIVHITSERGVTKYQWAMVIAKQFGLDTTKIKIRNGSEAQRPDHTKMAANNECMTSDIEHGTEILHKQLGCVFRLIYKSLPYERVYNKNIGEYRYILGKQLVNVIPENVKEKLDYVVPVPSSGLYYAMGLAEELQIPYMQALVKPDTKARSFQLADVALRERVIQDKIYPIEELIRGKIIALVDEAIFTGTTLRVICDMLRECGVKSIYICIPTPVCTHNCKQYIQPERKLLIDKVTSRVEDYFMVDGVFFQTCSTFHDSIEDVENICYECFGSEDDSVK